RPSQRTGRPGADAPPGLRRRQVDRAAILRPVNLLVELVAAPRAQTPLDPDRLDPRDERLNLPGEREVARPKDRPDAELARAHCQLTELANGDAVDRQVHIAQPLDVNQVPVLGAGLRMLADPNDEVEARVQVQRPKAR